MGLDLDDFGELDLEDGVVPAATGDDMAVKSLTLSLAQINAAATPSGAAAAISLVVTDVEDASGSAQFKTATDAAAANNAWAALNLLAAAPLFSSSNSGGGLLILVAGTSGYNGVHEVASSGITVSGGKLAFKTTTAIGGTESGLTGAVSLSKMCVWAFPLTLPATSQMVAAAISVLGTAPAGATAINARVAYMRANGDAVYPVSAVLAGIDRYYQESSTGGIRSATGAGHGPLDRSQSWLVVDCNAQADRQLDDITGLDAGVAMSLVYAESPALGS